MNTFIQKYQPEIKGTLSGWDRLVFRGTIRTLAFVQGMAGYYIPSQIGFIIVLRKKTIFFFHEKHEKCEIFVLFVYFVEEYNQSRLRHDALPRTRRLSP